MSAMKISSGARSWSSGAPATPLPDSFDFREAPKAEWACPAIVDGCLFGDLNWMMRDHSEFPPAQ
jgi:hypothetical protein